MHFAYSYVGTEFDVSAGLPETKGDPTVVARFESTFDPDPAHGVGAPGRVILLADGLPHMDATLPLSLGLAEGLSCGRDEASPVTVQYHAPSRSKAR